MRIDFPGYSGPRINWDDFVHPDPHQNISVLTAVALFRGLEAIGLLRPAEVFVRGQNVQALEVSRAVAAGLPETKPVNVICTLTPGAPPRTVAFWVKWLSSDFAGGVRMVYDDVRAELGLPEQFNEWLIEEHGKSVFIALSETFAAAM